MIPSYSSIYNLGHRALIDLFSTEVEVSEKVDGSQLSLMKKNGVLECRSKGQQLVIEAPDKMFTKAIETAIELLPLLQEGYIYRCEYLNKPKHNCLAYDRIPNKYLIVYNIDKADQDYMSYEEMTVEASRLGLEVVPLLFRGVVENKAMLFEFLERTSILGGQKIEGFVIKNYKLFDQSKKTLMGKFVSEAFKEVHQKDWKITNPGKGDVLEQLCAMYLTEARWNKAIQHLKELGQLTDSPKDIGNLIKEVQTDIQKECEDEIKEKLYKWAKEKILRASVRGLPEWYKNVLVDKQFEVKNNG